MIDEKELSWMASEGESFYRMWNKPAKFQWKHVSFTIIIIYLLEQSRIWTSNTSLAETVRRSKSAKKDTFFSLFKCTSFFSSAMNKRSCLLLVSVELQGLLIVTGAKTAIDKIWIINRYRKRLKHGRSSHVHLYITIKFLKRDNYIFPRIKIHSQCIRSFWFFLVLVFVCMLCM